MSKKKVPSKHEKKRKGRAPATGGTEGAKRRHHDAGEFDPHARKGEYGEADARAADPHTSSD